MDKADESSGPRRPHPDPEIEALLQFTPVARRTCRRDGWPAEVQRGFIAGLAECGSADKAAQALGRTMSGAYKVSTAAGGEGFREAWSKAVDLFLERNPRVPLTGRWRPSDGKAAPRSADGEQGEHPEFAGLDPEEREQARLEIFQRILHKYALKLRQEREVRLSGRIAEADFYVRQLTVMEIALDLGHQAFSLVKSLRQGELGLLDIAATPMSLYLDGVRRSIWAEAGEPDRPPLSPLGEHDGEAATGDPTTYWSPRDGDPRQWKQRQREKQALAAEAQIAWEEKARADAEAWRSRVRDEGGAGEEQA